MNHKNDLPDTMSGVLLNGYGDYDRLEYRDDIPLPSPAHHEVLIRVGAAAMNNTDINTRKAWYAKEEGNSENAAWSGVALDFPRIQGADVCGTIVAVGEQVSDERLNDRVLVEPCFRYSEGKALAQPIYFGSECDGGFAQYTLVPSQYAHRIKSDYSDVELASFPCSYSTAENMLSRAQVAAGQTVLITGASGGVGSAAIQLAKARGANVIAITSPSKAKEVAALGADEVVMRNDDLTKVVGQNTVDVVIDLVAGEQWQDLLTVIKPFGKYAVAGAIGNAHVKLDVRTLYLKDLTFLGCTVLDDHVFVNLIKHIENKAIAPLVHSTFPLKEIVKAQEFFLEKKHVGKIVFRVG